MPIEELLAAGRAALQAGRWADARAAFERSLSEEETAAALAGLGEALWWLGETRASIDHYQRAYARYRQDGDRQHAALIAIWLSITYRSNFGNFAAASGWVSRAERLLEQAGPEQLHGWLLFTRAYATPDPDLARQINDRALQLARAIGDPDLELCALSQFGRALVAIGEVDAGLRLIDEAMAGTLGGECSRLDTVVFTSCDMLTACDLAGDLERATQWCRVADDFIRKYGCPFLYARCRTIYGSILVARGRWIDGERELVAAIHMTADVGPELHADARARLADLRLRQGRLEEAEALLAGHDEPTAALAAAATCLARGQPIVAVALLERRLQNYGEEYVGAAWTLALLVDAHLARGDLVAACSVAARLVAAAATRSDGPAPALTAQAAARIARAEGRSDDAVELLERALDGFGRLDLPFETARVRLDLARVVAERQPELAVAEARRALAVFDHLGAVGDADQAAALLRTLGARGRGGPRDVGILTRREQEVLHLLGLGLSNPEIAARLVISRKTAAHHVSSVLAKLDLRNRAEAVAYVARVAPTGLP